MTVLGLTPRSILGLVREAQAQPTTRPILVVGPRSAELAALLTEEGDGALVRTSGNPEEVTAVVVVCDGGPGSADLVALRAAARAGVTTIAVRAGGGGALPYVLSGNVVEMSSGSPLPVEPVARLLARAGSVGVALASGLPAVRDPTRRRRVLESTLAAATLAVRGRDESPRLPVISLLQARMLRDLDLAGGQSGAANLAGAARLVGPELAASLGIGLCARRLSRTLPIRGRVVDATLAGVGTLALGLGALRLR